PAAISDSTLSRVRRVADELDARVTMPVQESAARLQDSLSWDGRRPLQRLQALGLLRPGFGALHLTQLDESDLEIVTRTGVCVIACPQADLRQAGGHCPVNRLQASTICVALGTDSPIDGGALDILAEARTAALLGARGDRAAPGLSAAAALRMATDLVCLDLGSLEFRPPMQPAEAIVFGATRSQVSDVWTSGRAAVSGGRLLAFDDHEMRALGRRWSERIRPEVLT